MAVNLEVLLFYAYRYSEEMGKATEVVIKGNPTRADIDHLYALVKKDGGKHLSADVYMALLDVVRHAMEAHRE